MVASAFVTARPSRSTLKRLQSGLAAFWEKSIRRTALMTSDQKLSQEKAIKTLHSRMSDLDSREWAERYLCGLAGSDEKAFTRDRPAQS
jgi:hypothetical protein